MQKITKRQIKLFAACFITVAAFLCFWVFGYGPQGENLGAAKQELSFAEGQIAQIKNIMQGKEPSGAVRDLNGQLISLISYFPENQEDIISSLSNRSRKFNIEIKSINPHKKVILEEKVSGYEIQEVPISMSLQCGFKNLGEFLNDLRTNFPALVRVKSLNLRGRGEGQPTLDINLELLAYLSKTK